MAFFYDAALQVLLCLDPITNKCAPILAEVIEKDGWDIQGLRFLPRPPKEVHHQIGPFVAELRKATKLGAPPRLWTPD
jgi:hypothetical protein